MCVQGHVCSRPCRNNNLSLLQLYLMTCVVTHSLIDVCTCREQICCDPKVWIASLTLFAGSSWNYVSAVVMLFLDEEQTLWIFELYGTAICCSTAIAWCLLWCAPVWLQLSPIVGLTRWQLLSMLLHTIKHTARVATTSHNGSGASDKAQKSRPHQAQRSDQFHQPNNQLKQLVLILVVGVVAVSKSKSQPNNKQISNSSPTPQPINSHHDWRCN